MLLKSNSSEDTFYEPKKCFQNIYKIFYATNSFSPDICFSKLIDVPNLHLRNYVYQILQESGEGNWMLKCYHFEKIRENRNTLLKEKKRTYFSINKVAKLVIHHEIYRTRQYP